MFQPRELAITQTRMQRDLVPGILRNVHAIVHGIGRARRNQAHIHHCARRPRVPLVDGIAVRIDLQRAVEVRAFLHRTFAVVFDLATPENRLPFVIRALQFEPGVVRIDGAAGEEMPNFFRAHHYVHAHSVASPHHRLHRFTGAVTGRNLSAASRRPRNLGFFADREGRRQIGCDPPPRWLAGLRRRERKDVDGQNAVLQEIIVTFSCSASSLADGQPRVGRREPMRVHEAVHVAESFDGASGMWQSAHCCGFGG